MNNRTNKPYQHTLPAKLPHFFSCILLSGVSLASNAMAASYNDSYNSNSYSTGNGATQPGLKQPKIRWYRFYNSEGQPTLSSSISEQQMKYGYEALDKNMQVVKRVSPYTAEQYALQKAQRDAAAAKKNADLDLKKSYGSSVAATAKRDQVLADMASRRSYLVTQLISLQATLSGNIALAANYERQQQAIPKSLQKNLAESRKNVNEAEQNIAAIDARQQQVRAEYEVIIRRLSALEHGE